ncbi:phosphoinositide phospholipase C 2-like [Apium graveolens]|uniref:phosphoinositide phospholipase C 2-like n=1 Tax=Apium graveolens TaxID=4045 RepID=UPI003D7AE84F
MSKERYGCCCFWRKYKLGVAEAPLEIKQLFEKYSENGIMSLHHFQRFIKEVQGEAAEASIETMFNNIKDQKINKHFTQNKGLTIEGFFRYLFDGHINPPLPFPPKVHHNMRAPLSHYFIFTGHNSYLTGNQLSSDSSDIPIIDALHRGVRVIELDMWPNSTKDDVHVVHGGTLTNPVELIKCLRSIKQHAFVKSEYPVILTLEDHLTPVLQAKVAKMVSETFGDMLFISGSESFAEFPSPELLKRKILISTKPPKEYLESKNIKVMHIANEHKEKVSAEEKAWGTEVSDIGKEMEVVDVEIDDGEAYNEEGLQDDKSNLKQNVDPEYKHLIAICARKRKGGIKDWLHDDPNKVTRISLREQNLESAVIDHGADVIRFTRRNLLRIFPKGSRVDSSNYSPFIGWMHGAQMVAFNMQGYGRSLWLMQGLFRANGGCGYVKKPDFLLKVGPKYEVFDPKRKLLVKKTLKVKIYVGEGWHNDFDDTHFDIYSPPDFYVKVGIAGVPYDSVMRKTKTIQDKWIPTWNEEFEFPLTVPELALLRIEVHEYDLSDNDDFAGQTCLPVPELKTGIRAVPLCNQKGDEYKSVKLLTRFQFV